MSNDKNIRLVLLAGPGPTSEAMANFLVEEFGLSAIVLERKVASWRLMKARARRVGWLEVLGQAIFVVCARLLNVVVRRDLESLFQKYGLKIGSYPDQLVSEVASVNSSQVAQILRDHEPDIVVVNGTRIISQDILTCVSAPFLNVHLGITPKYRGVHGGYWALALGDEGNCGATIHLVDQGIDTGGILAQVKIDVDDGDHFLTYPIHQFGTAVPYLKEQIKKVATNEYELVFNELPSKLYYHPTIWRYLWIGLTRRVF